MRSPWATPYVLGSLRTSLGMLSSANRRYRAALDARTDSPSAGKWVTTTKVTASSETALLWNIGGTVVDRNHAGVIGVPVGANDRERLTLTNGVAVTGATTADLLCIALDYSTGFGSSQP